MNQNYSRIPFGHETNLEIPTNTCPGCNINRGQFHEYGCPVETCPKCSGRLLKCACMVLSIVDEMKITKAVAATLSKEQVLNMTDNSKTLDKSYTEKAGVTWIILNAPPQLQKEMEEMAIDILGAKKKGDMVLVPLEKAAEILGMTIEEVAPIMQELETECLYPDWENNTGTLQ